MKAEAEVHILVVALDPKLAVEMRARAGPSYRIHGAHSGGEALDRCSSSRYQVAMIADDLDDLPPTMVIRSLRAQSPDTMVLTLSRSPHGMVVHMVEGDRKVLLAERVGSPQDLVSKLDSLTEAFRVRERERRYLQAFRERHYDFLRRYAALKTRIDKVQG
jgi:DNA-binding NarL/FixJ family response regulator